MMDVIVAFARVLFHRPAAGEDLSIPRAPNPKGRRFFLPAPREGGGTSGAPSVCALFRACLWARRGGGFVVKTGRFTGRSPKDKYIVREPGTAGTVDWGDVNQPMSEQVFDQMYARLLHSLETEELFIQDCFAGADPEYTLPIRVITERAWHSLFARELFIRPNPLETDRHKPEFTVLFAPRFYADPAKDGTRSTTCIALNFKKRVVMIAGTEYAGEVKKSIFTILNYLLPARGVLPMHCSANIGRGGDVALFFGLSGTGKTTLSADPARRLIGDDEHGWSDHGGFHFEGGCYAKCIRFAPRKEPAR